MMMAFKPSHYLPHASWFFYLFSSPRFLHIMFCHVPVSIKLNVKFVFIRLFTLHIKWSSWNVLIYLAQIITPDMYPCVQKCMCNKSIPKVQNNRNNKKSNRIKEKACQHMIKWKSLLYLTLFKVIADLIRSVNIILYLTLKGI